MEDPRVAVLVFFGGAWPALVLVAGFLVFMRQAYGAWEDQRAWAATGWVAGPVLLAVLGLASSLILLLAVPAVEAPSSLLASVFAAVLAPAGSSLKVAAALLLASAPIAFWRVRPHALGEAVHASGACIVIAVALAAVGTDLQVHQALLIHAGSDSVDLGRIGELRGLGATTRPLVGLATLAVVAATGGFGAIPTLRASVRDLARWLAAVAVLGVSVYGVVVLRTTAFLP